MIGAIAECHFFPHVPQHGIFDPHHHPEQPRWKGPRQRGLDQSGVDAHIARISSKLNGEQSTS